MSRPVIYVLAGVNGGGKSSVGGHLLRSAGFDWFNPDSFARMLRAQTDFTIEVANAAAWREGLRRLDHAISHGHSHALETTLGGRTMPAMIGAATRSHDVVMWFVGLATPEKHIERVRARVSAGGHDIPEDKIRERFVLARENLIALMPSLADLAVYDNSATAAPNRQVPEPVLVVRMENGRLVWPDDSAQLHDAPEWAKPIVEAALQISR